MQTPKASRNSFEMPQRKSPGTPRTPRQLKSPRNDSDATSSPRPSIKTQKDQKAPKSSASEKKRTSNVSEMDAQYVQLKEDLKKAKVQMNASELLKRQAQQEAEEVKKQLSAMSARLEESEQQLMEISASEDSRVLELRKISQDRDRSWQSELEALQKQHSLDSAALSSAMNEMQKLKVQVEKAYDAEAVQAKHADSAYAEIQTLRNELSETISLVENIKSELTDCRESEARALDILSETQMQLATESATVEMLRSEGAKANEAYKSLSLELEQSNARVTSLEGLVSKLQAELSGFGGKTSEDTQFDAETSQEITDEEMNQLKNELNFAKLEVSQLRSALDAAEVRYQEEYIQSTLQIRSAYEQVESMKTESRQRGEELEAELKKSKDHIEELRANLLDKQTELQSITEENMALNTNIVENQPHEREFELEMDVKKLEASLAELKMNLSDKEIELEDVTEKNEKLEMEIAKMETEKSRENVQALALEEAKTAEQEALMKLEHLTEEADMSSRRAERVTEQLDAAQAANSELEAELRRLKVQADQWRKAAEAAAAMLSTGNNGKYAEKTASFNSIESPYLEDTDDESPKKKNGNMLRKIGVLWKKNQK